MSVNIIIFDGQYIADQIRNIDKAKTLAEEAIEIIKKANQHRNWKCSETTQIENALNNISNKLGRLNTGIIETANTLGRGLRGFTELEQRMLNQANTLSSNLQNQYGFSASNYGHSGNSNLPVTQIPDYSTNTPVTPAINTHGNGDNVDDDFASSVITALIEGGRMATYVVGSAVGSFLGAIGGMAKGALSSFGLIDTLGGAALAGKVNGNIANISSTGEMIQNIGESVNQWTVLKAGVSSFFGGMDGALSGEKAGREFTMKLYETIFGKSPSFSFLDSDKQNVSSTTDLIWGDIKNGINSLPIVGEELSSLFGVNTNS